MTNPLIDSLVAVVAERPEDLPLRAHLAELLVVDGRGPEAVPHLGAVLADDGAAVILVTHDLGAAALAESVLIMRDGRIVDHRCGATPDELLVAVNQTGAAA